jgi:hypothetical protein
MALFALAYNVCGSTGKKREKAGSLAALGMTNQKSKNKDKDKNPAPIPL